MKVSVNPRTTVFHEGNLVSPKDNPEQVYLVTCASIGYDLPREGTFWAIDITSDRISGGNYLKDLFQEFRGRIVIEA